MSYDIYIGEATLDLGYVEVGDEPTVSVIEAHCSDAPTFAGDDMTGDGNSRHPSYTGWDDFVRDVGLHDLFFDKNRGLMREHPGTFLLGDIHAQEIKEALDEYRERHRGAVAGFTRNMTNWHSGAPEDRPGVNPQLARLEWLAYWVQWAVDNCRFPVIHNH